MKRCIGQLILSAVILFDLAFVSIALAEMRKVDDKELAGTNARVTKAASPKTIPPTVIFDNKTNNFTQNMSKSGEGFSLNLTANPETWTYNYNAFNPNYWGSISGVKSSR